jgi:hypothetical protein
MSHLKAQVRIGLLSHSESFYSPNESLDGAKSFGSGYNKFNFSSKLGVTIGYKINKRFSILVGGQLVDRKFDNDCIKVIMLLSNVYKLSDSTCSLGLKATYKFFQLPLSIKYSFESNNENITHSIGVGHTITYSLGREDLLYNGADSLRIKYLPNFIWFFAPEIYYELNARLMRQTFFTASFGIREEITTQLNHALFGKVGITYSFEKEKRKHKRR